MRYWAAGFSRLEAELLHCLSAGEICPLAVLRRRIVEVNGDYASGVPREYADKTNAVGMVIHRLRAKLLTMTGRREPPMTIRNHYGSGYSMNAESLAKLRTLERP